MDLCIGSCFPRTAGRKPESRTKNGARRRTSRDAKYGTASQFQPVAVLSLPPHLANGIEEFQTDARPLPFGKDYQAAGAGFDKTLPRADGHMGHGLAVHKPT